MMNEVSAHRVGRRRKEAVLLLPRIERGDLEHAADAVLERQLEVIVEIEIRGEILAGGVEAAEEIRAVVAGAALARTGVAVAHGEGADGGGDAAAVAERLGELQRHVRLGDAAELIEVHEASVPDLVRAHDDVGRHARVSDGHVQVHVGIRREREIGPVTGRLARHARRAVQLEARPPVVVRPDAEAHRRAHVAFQRVPPALVDLAGGVAFDAVAAVVATPRPPDVMSASLPRSTAVGAAPVVMRSERIRLAAAARAAGAPGASGSAGGGSSAGIASTAGGGTSVLAGGGASAPVVQRRPRARGRAATPQARWRPGERRRARRGWSRRSGCRRLGSRRFFGSSPSSQRRHCDQEERPTKDAPSPTAHGGERIPSLIVFSHLEEPLPRVQGRDRCPHGYKAAHTFLHVCSSPDISWLRGYWLSRAAKRRTPEKRACQGKRQRESSPPRSA